MRRDTLRATTAIVLTTLAVPALVIAAPNVGILGQAPAPAASASASAAPSDEDKRKQAIEHFNKGVELMQSDSFDAAYAEFLASIALLPTKNAKKNAAACLRELKRFDEALAMYEAVLAEFAAKLTPAETDNVKKSIEELRAVTAYLVIKSNVDGATVVIDGKDKGKTPLPGPVIVSAGTRSIRVSKEGYLPFELSKPITGKATLTIEANLEALARSGKISVVETSGKTMDVYVDGAKVGVTPYVGQASPGNHAVVLKGEGKLGTQPAAAAVVVDQTTVLRLTAEELRGEAHIEPDPASGVLVLDGVLVGQGAWDGALRLGSHKVDVSADGYFGLTKTFEVIEGKKADLKLPLERDENSPFWAKGRTFPLSFAVFGGLEFGKSLGGAVESNCGNACTSHSAPFGFLAGVRAGYDVAPGLGIEVSAGYVSVTSKVTRDTQLPGDHQVLFPVNVTDTQRISGFFIGIGASYAFIKRPFILAGAFTGGVILGKIRSTRGGTVRTDLPPDPRDLYEITYSQSKTIPILIPEVRISYPFGPRFEVGLGLGLAIMVAEATPDALRVSPVPANDPSTGKLATPTYGGKSIGQIQHLETSTGTAILPQATLFAKIAF